MTAYIFGVYFIYLYEKERSILTTKIVQVNYLASRLMTVHYYTILTIIFTFLLAGPGRQDLF